MKILNIKYILVLLMAVMAVSCEEVVDVDLDTAAPRLVVDASINWIKGTDGSQQKIRLTTTAPYYDTTVPAVSGATVYITNSTGIQFDFLEQVAGSGEYICTTFVPQIGETYTLTIENGTQVYKATEQLYATPDITNIVQDDEGGFLNEDYEIRFYYQDNATQANYYMHRFASEVRPYPDYDVLDDEFFQGNEMFGISSDENYAPGQTVDIQLYGISERYFNYMEKLITLAEGGSGGGPFQTAPATVRGNIINQTAMNDYALGYFRLGEVDKAEYTIQ